MQLPLQVALCRQIIPDKVIGKYIYITFCIVNKIYSKGDIDENIKKKQCQNC